MNNYKWFLDLLYSEGSNFPILETGICRGTKLVDWYSRSRDGCVSKNSTSVINLTRTLLNRFLSKSTSNSYDPQKLICYLYHQKGLRLLNCREVKDLADNYLHGLQVSSIHLAVPTMHEPTAYYEASSWMENGEFKSEIKLIGGKQQPKLVEDVLLIDKTLEIIEFVIETFKEKTGKLTKALKFHLVVNIRGRIQIIKIIDLKLVPDSPKISEKTLRHNFISFLDTEPAEDQENPLVLSFLQKKNKIDTSRTDRVSICKKPEPITPEFVEMVYRTLRKQQNKENYQYKTKIEKIQSLNDLILHLDKSEIYRKNLSFLERNKIGICSGRTRKRSLPFNHRTL